MLPPVHLGDVRENLAALAEEAGTLLRTVAAELRDAEWDTRSAGRWSDDTARLERRLQALRSARAWSRESLRMTGRPFGAAARRAPRTVPPMEEERFSRVTGHVGALTRTPAVAADDGRTPAPPDGPALKTYARLLELIGTGCRQQGHRLR